ncbi:hypothetical protein IWQ56_002794 [Coemansia nantahalensis]|nr:hypothetical protein IWQ56_002794 [Coemansia nantahalensis]
MAPKYSLWLSPPGASPASQAVAAAIDKLSSALGGPRFPPHATLFSPVRADSDAKALEQVEHYAAKLRRQLGADTAGIPVEVDSVAAGSTYYQCVFLKGPASEALAAANAAAREQWGAAGQEPFMPHVSLVYGDHPADALPGLQTQAAEALPKDLAALSYVATEIRIVATSGQCEQWHEVGRVSITRQGEVSK